MISQSLFAAGLLLFSRENKLLSFRLVRNYQSWLAENFSERSRIRLNWLKVILAALLVLYVQWFVEIILRDAFNIYFQYDYTMQLLGLLVLILGMAGFRQPSLAGVVFEPASKEAAFTPDAAILQKIREAMEQRKLYLNPTLNLNELSTELKLNSRTVSRHINAGFNQTFTDFVNTYRVAEVKRRLHAGNLRKLTMLAIAFGSGFNSKTSFNRIFKEITGVPPSGFK